MAISVSGVKEHNETLFSDNTVVFLHTGVHVSISVFVCMFEEVALESDVHSDYYTVGY